MVPARATTNAAGDRRRARSARVRIGYGRVSTRDQHLEAQHDALTAAGCEQVYMDVASGKLAARPELDKTLACLRKGDTLVITRLDRLGRSLPHLLEVSAELRERNVDLIVLQQQIDTSTAAGRMFSRCSALSASSSATCSPNAPATSCGPRALAAAPAAANPSSSPRTCSSHARCATSSTTTADDATPCKTSPTSSTSAAARSTGRSIAPPGSGRRDVARPASGASFWANAHVTCQPDRRSRPTRASALSP